MDLPAGVEPAVFYRQRLEGPCFSAFHCVDDLARRLAAGKAGCRFRRAAKSSGHNQGRKKAIKAQAVRRKKCLVAAVLTSNFLVLGYFKYWSYFAELLSGAFSATAPSSLGLVMPLGISFYTFQAVGYLIDCYRGRTQQRKTTSAFCFSSAFSRS